MAKKKRYTAPAWYGSWKVSRFTTKGYHQVKFVPSYSSGSRYRPVKRQGVSNA